MQYWSYADVWLPNDANFEATNQISADRWSRSSAQQAEVWGKQHPDKDGKAIAHSALCDDVGGRREPALLVFAVAAVAAAQLCGGAG